MRLYSLLLTVVAIAKIVTSVEANSIKVSTTDLLNNTRNLRNDNRDTFGNDSEERVYPVGASSIVEKVTETATGKMIELKGRRVIQGWMPPEQVKDLLQLGGKFGTDLTGSKLYKFYRSFWTKFEGSMEQRVRQGTSTYSAWTMLGLETFPRNVLKESQEFKLYAKYVNLVDDEVLKSGKIPNQSEVGEFLKSEAEMTVKVKLWAKEKKPNDYVEKSLGLAGLTGETLERHVNYRVF